MNAGPSPNNTLQFAIRRTYRTFAWLMGIHLLLYAIHVFFMDPRFGRGIITPAWIPYGLIPVALLVWTMSVTGAVRRPRDLLQAMSLDTVHLKKAIWWGLAGGLLLSGLLLTLYPSNVPFEFRCFMPAPRYIVRPLQGLSLFVEPLFITFFIWGIIYGAWERAWNRPRLAVCVAAFLFFGFNRFHIVQMMHYTPGRFVDPAWWEMALVIFSVTAILAGVFVRTRNLVAPLLAQALMIITWMMLVARL